MQKLDTIAWKWRKMEKIKDVDTRYYRLEICRYQILQTGNMQILDTIACKYVDTRYYSL